MREHPLWGNFTSGCLEAGSAQGAFGTERLLSHCRRRAEMPGCLLWVGSGSAEQSESDVEANFSGFDR